MTDFQSKARFLAALIAITALSVPAVARVTPAEYREIGVTVPAQASLPLTPPVIDSDGRSRRLKDIISHPTVLIFADYTCRTLCGPILAFVASALEQTGLRPGEQFQLLVVGLDPKDSTQDAAAMRKRYLLAGSSLSPAATFVRVDSATITALTAALGYRYQYDADDDMYVHPAAAYILQADGRVSRVLAGVGISTDDLRLALVEASAGKVGTFGDQVRLLCSGFDPAHGTYNLIIGRLLALAAAATVLTLGGGIALLLLAGRRRAA
jgi:protein SCO1/2